MIRHAFTLMELLVVIAIIGLLSTFLLAGIGSSQQIADDKAAYSFLTVVDEGLRQYRVEYGFYPPSRNGTNNLSYALNHPKPKLPKSRTERDKAKNIIGYPNDYLWGKLDAQHYNYDGLDFDALTPDAVNTDPLPLLDTFYQEGSEFGSPVIYAYNIAGRTLYTNSDFNYDVRTHARKGFTGSFDLWSAGADAVFDADYKLHDLDLEPNKDNVTATAYK